MGAGRIRHRAGQVIAGGTGWRCPGHAGGIARNRGCRRSGRRRGGTLPSGRRCGRGTFGGDRGFVACRPNRSIATCSARRFGRSTRQGVAGHSSRPCGRAALWAGCLTQSRRWAITSHVAHGFGRINATCPGDRTGWRDCITPRIPQGNGRIGRDGPIVTTCPGGGGRGGIITGISAAILGGGGRWRNRFAVQIRGLQNRGSRARGLARLGGGRLRGCSIPGGDRCGLGPCLGLRRLRGGRNRDPTGRDRIARPVRSRGLRGDRQAFGGGQRRRLGRVGRGRCGARRRGQPGILPRLSRTGRVGLGHGLRGLGQWRGNDRLRLIQGVRRFGLVQRIGPVCRASHRLGLTFSGGFGDPCHGRHRRRRGGWGWQRGRQVLGAGKFGTCRRRHLRGGRWRDGRVRRALSRSGGGLRRVSSAVRIT